MSSGEASGEDEGWVWATATTPAGIGPDHCACLNSCVDGQSTHRTEWSVCSTRNAAFSKVPKPYNAPLTRCAKQTMTEGSRRTPGPSSKTRAYPLSAHASSDANTDDRTSLLIFTPARWDCR